MDKKLSVTNVCWELLFILNCNTETDNDTMKLRGSVFERSESEYFLLAPKIGHTVQENTEGNKMQELTRSCIHMQIAKISEL